MSTYSPLDKNFKCAKTLKVLLAGRPKSAWKGMFDAQQALASFKRRSASKREASAADA